MRMMGLVGMMTGVTTMGRTRTWRCITLALGIAATGCASYSGSDPTPIDVGSETRGDGAHAPTVPIDTAVRIGAMARAETTAVTDSEVESEVRRLFGEGEFAELEAETASWDIPITVNEAVERWLEYFQGDGRQNFAVYLSRAGRYESMMRANFRHMGLPEDLVYLSLIESGFSPRAYSRAHAVGLWQFIASTGRRYGLDVSYWVDDRRDPILATRAAAAHLRDLYEDFGSWYLAAAAYNAGPNRVRRSIRRARSRDFWTIANRRYLRRETRNYVPKLIAAALIAKQPEKYGFVGIRQAEPLAYEMIRVPDATSLEVLAKAAGVPVDQLAELNPQILRGVTPPGTPYTVRVPPGTGHVLALNYARVASSERVTWIQHVVRRGETLSHIARYYGISVSAIRASNRSVHPRRLRIGQRLVIPRAGRIPLFASSPTKTGGQPGGRYITHRVQRGDTLWAIALRYNVSTRDLMRWNGLTSSRIHPGDEVRVYVGS